VAAGADPARASLLLREGAGVVSGPGQGFGQAADAELGLLPASRLPSSGAMLETCG
jgi:hypothetical protein